MAKIVCIIVLIQYKIFQWKNQKYVIWQLSTKKLEKMPKSSQNGRKRQNASSLAIKRSTIATNLLKPYRIKKRKYIYSVYYCMVHSFTKSFREPSIFSHTSLFELGFSYKEKCNQPIIATILVIAVHGTLLFKIFQWISCLQLWSKIRNMVALYQKLPKSQRKCQKVAKMAKNGNMHPLWP